MPDEDNKKDPIEKDKIKVRDNITVGDGNSAMNIDLKSLDNKDLVELMRNDLGERNSEIVKEYAKALIDIEEGLKEINEKERKDMDNVKQAIAEIEKKYGNKNNQSGGSIRQEIYNDPSEEDSPKYQKSPNTKIETSEEEHDTVTTTNTDPSNPNQKDKQNRTESPTDRSKPIAKAFGKVSTEDLEKMLADSNKDDEIIAIKQVLKDRKNNDSDNTDDSDPAETVLVPDENSVDVKPHKSPFKSTANDPTNKNHPHKNTQDNNNKDPENQSQPDNDKASDPVQDIEQSNTPQNEQPKQDDSNVEDSQNPKENEQNSNPQQELDGIKHQPHAHAGDGSGKKDDDKDSSKQPSPEKTLDKRDKGNNKESTGDKIKKEAKDKVKKALITAIVTSPIFWGIIGLIILFFIIAAPVFTVISCVDNLDLSCIGINASPIAELLNTDEYMDLIKKLIPTENEEISADSTVEAVKKAMDERGI